MEAMKKISTSLYYEFSFQMYFYFDSDSNWWGSNLLCLERRIIEISLASHNQRSTVTGDRAEGCL